MASTEPLRVRCFRSGCSTSPKARQQTRARHHDYPPDHNLTNGIRYRIVDLVNPQRGSDVVSSPRQSAVFSSRAIGAIESVLESVVVCSILPVKSCQPVFRCILDQEAYTARLVLWSPSIETPSCIQIKAPRRNGRKE